MFSHKGNNLALTLNMFIASRESNKRNQDNCRSKGIVSPNKENKKNVNARCLVLRQNKN